MSGILRVRTRLAGLAVAASVLLAGCGSFGGAMPVAGTGTITAGPSLATNADPEDVAVAQREHPNILAAYGGAYSDPDAEMAVAQAVGRLIGPGGPSYRITILNSPAVNAFALPGGYVYVTRGLLALANDSAELAAVIAHEMAHIVANHASARQQQAETAAILNRVATDVLQDPEEAEATLDSARLQLAQFSQAQEREADRIGIEAIAAAGYDPYGAVRFLTSMGRFAAYQTATDLSDSEGDFLSSHPTTPARIAAAEALAASLRPASAQGADTYLTHLEGLMFGDDAVEGFIRGRQFLHSELGLAFTVPEGFALENTADAVLATGRDGSAMRFDGVDLPAMADLVGYIRSGWINGLISSSVEAGAVGGAPAAFASAATGGYSYRIAVVRLGNATYRFLFATRRPTAAFEQAFTSTVSSFRALSPAERENLHPLRLHIVTVAPGQTAEQLAQSMAPGLDRPAELFRTLNGLAPGQQPRAGSLVKLVVE